MAQPKPILFTDLDLKQLNFPAVGKDIRSKLKSTTEGGVAGAGGGMTVFNITYGPSKAPIYVRFPVCISTIGLRRNVLGDKYTIPFTFTNVDPYAEKMYGEDAGQVPTEDPYYSQGQLYNFFKNLEKHLHATVQEKADAWLNVKDLSDKRVKELFNPVIKVHQDRVLGAPTGKYAPTVTLEVGSIGVSQLDICVRDLRPHAASKNVLDNKTDTILANLKGGVHLRGVFSFNGLFFVNNKFTATFTLMYAELMPPMSTAVVRTAASAMNWDMLEDTEDEKVAQEAAHKKARRDDDGQTFAATSFLATERAAQSSFRPIQAAGAGATSAGGV